MRLKEWIEGLCFRKRKRAKKKKDGHFVLSYLALVFVPFLLLYFSLQKVLQLWFLLNHNK